MGEGVDSKNYVEFRVCSVKEVEMNKAVLPRKVGILHLDLRMDFFSFLAGSVLSAALSIMFAFYKSDCYKEICICILQISAWQLCFEGLIWDRIEMQMMSNSFPMMLSSFAF